MIGLYRHRTAAVTLTEPISLKEKDRVQKSLRFNGWHMATYLSNVNTMISQTDIILKVYEINMYDWQTQLIFTHGTFVPPVQMGKPLPNQSKRTYVSSTQVSETQIAFRYRLADNFFRARFLNMMSETVLPKIPMMMMNGVR